MNATPNSGGSTRKTGIDGGAAVAADRDTVIRLGDTIALRYGS
ncbi:hypothetical protein ABZ721_12360 [Streptomyces sp. NPDC006733]